MQKIILDYFFLLNSIPNLDGKPNKSIRLSSVMSDNKQPVELLSLEMDQIMHFFLSITSTKAVQYLGAPTLEGIEPVKDLEKARLAIDCTRFLIEKLEPYVPAEEAKQLNAVVSNLQFAYLKETG